MIYREKRAATIEKVKDAMVSLLRDYELQSITKKMLYEKADIHKTTLDYYFENIDEVFLLLVADKKSQLISMFTDDDKCMQFNKGKIVALLELVKKDKSIYLNLSNSNIGKKALNEITTFLFKKFCENNMSPHKSTTASYYYIEIVAAILQIWLEHDCKESVENIALLLTNTIKIIVQEL